MIAEATVEVRLSNIVVLSNLDMSSRCKVGNASLDCHTRIVPDAFSVDVTDSNLWGC